MNAYVVEQARLLGESIATVANDVVAASSSGSGGSGTNGINRSGAKESRRSSVATSSGANEPDGDTQNGVAYLYEIRILEDKLRQLDADYEATRQHLATTDASIRTNEEHDDGGRPVSVHDIRLEAAAAAAAMIRPKSAGGASQNVGPSAMRSMTPTDATPGAPPNPNTRNTII